jgi:chromosome segregation ATPase
MISFLTNKQAAEKIADLEQRLEVLQRDNDAAQAQIGELQTENANLSEQVSTLTEANASLTSQAEALTATASAMTAERDEAITLKLEAEEKLSTFDDQVEAAALVKFQSLGGAQASVASQSIGADQQLTREQFNALPPHKRLEYVKAGGTLKA